MSFYPSQFSHPPQFSLPSFNFQLFPPFSCLLTSPQTFFFLHTHCLPLPSFPSTADHRLHLPHTIISRTAFLFQLQPFPFLSLTSFFTFFAFLPSSSILIFKFSYVYPFSSCSSLSCLHLPIYQFFPCRHLKLYSFLLFFLFFISFRLTSLSIPPSSLSYFPFSLFTFSFVFFLRQLYFFPRLALMTDSVIRVF